MHPICLKSDQVSDMCIYKGLKKIIQNVLCELARMTLEMPKDNK